MRLSAGLVFTSHTHTHTLGLAMLGLAGAHKRLVASALWSSSVSQYCASNWFALCAAAVAETAHRFAARTLFIANNGARRIFFALCTRRVTLDARRRAPLARCALHERAPAAKTMARGERQLAERSVAGALLGRARPPPPPPLPLQRRALLLWLRPCCRCCSWRCLGLCQTVRCARYHFSTRVRSFVRVVRSCRCRIFPLTSMSL